MLRKWARELPERQTELERLENLPSYLLDARALGRIPYLRSRIVTLQERLANE